MHLKNTNNSTMSILNRSTSSQNNEKTDLTKLTIKQRYEFACLNYLG